MAQSAPALRTPPCASGPPSVKSGSSGPLPPWNSVCLTAPANDLRAALKAGVLVNRHTGSFDVTTNCGTGFQHTSVGSANVAIDCSLHNHRGHADLGPDLSMLTDGQCTGRVDSALHFAVNHQLSPESHIAFNRYSFGKHTFGSLSTCSKRLHATVGRNRRRRFCGRSKHGTLV